MSKARIEALEALDAGALVPGLGDRPFYTTEERDDGPAYFLARKDNACVFLAPDNRCRLHATHGAEAKPWFCRAFPFALIAAPSGLRLAWRPECSGRHRCDETSTPLQDQLPDVLADAEHYPMRAVHPAGTGLPGDVAIPPSLYPRIESALLDEARREREHFDDVFPALAALLWRLADAVSPEPVDRPSGGPWLEPALDLLDAYRDYAEQIHALAGDTALGNYADTFKTMLTVTPRAAALTPRAAAFLREELANHIFSGAVTMNGSLACGLGQFVVSNLACRANAARDHGEPVDEAAFNEAWARWHRGTTWRDPQDMLAAHRDALEAVFLRFDRPGADG